MVDFETVGEPFGYDEARAAVDYIENLVAKSELEMPKIAVTLGSGLKSFAERHTHPDRQAAGHDGQLIIAPIEKDSRETMAIWAGRIHFYQTLLRRCEQEWTRISDPEVRKAAIVFYYCSQSTFGG